MPLNLQDVLDAAQDADSPEARATAIKTLLSEGDPAPTRDEVNALCDEAVEKFGTLNEADPTDAESLLGLELLADVATVTLSALMMRAACAGSAPARACCYPSRRPVRAPTVLSNQ